MGDPKQTENTSSIKPSPLHPAYTVTNVQNKIRTLDGTKVTYSSWIKLFKLHAKAYKVLNHIDGTPSPAATEDGYGEWAEIDALVLQWIYSTLSDELLVRVLETDSTAQATWNKIQTIFLNNKGSRAAALEQEFTNLTLGSCTSMDHYCQKLKDLADQLGDVDNPVTESRLVLQLVRGLPPEYDVVAAYINQSSPTWDTARSMLQLEQHRQSARQNGSHTVLAMHNNDRPQPSHSSGNQVRPFLQNHHGYHSQPNRGRGYYGNRGRGRNSRGRGRGTQQYPNHAHSPYWMTNNAPPPTPFPSAPFSTGPPSSFHSAQQWRSPPSGPFPGSGRSSENFSASGSSHGYGPQAHFAGFSNFGPQELANTMQRVSLGGDDQTWFLDTGASSHIASDSGILTTPMVSSPIPSIFVGNGSSIPIHGSGNTIHQTHNRSYLLNNVLVTPHIIKNLLSVRKFNTDNNTSIEFDRYGFSVKDFQTGSVLSRHNSTGDLYPFTPSTSSTVLLTTTQDQWHNRLGHPGSQVLDLLRSRFSIPCNKTTVSSLCESCQLAKHIRLPFYDSNSLTLAPFDIIHCDLWTSPIVSKSGYKYYMVLIDNFTHYVWVYPLRFKSDTFTNFQKFHQFILTQFNKKIKTFQCARR